MRQVDKPAHALKVAPQASVPIRAQQAGNQINKQKG